MSNIQKRLPGRLAKVGIRPIIDGRRQGIRESLEDQTMGMAKSVSKFLSNNVKHPNGMNIECVIADGTIGGVAEAAMCTEKFERENIGLSITVTPCWCYSAEVLDDNSYIPKALWGFNGPERPGAKSLKNSCLPIF